MGGPPVRVLDATDEQFEVFIREAGVKVRANEEGERWSFDNRVRVINYARKRGLYLPFVDVPGIVSGNEKRSEERDERARAHQHEENQRISMLPGSRGE